MVRALDWGSRSREFESHHSDFYSEKEPFPEKRFLFYYLPQRAHGTPPLRHYSGLLILT